MEHSVIEPPCPDVWGCAPWVRSHPAPDVCVGAPWVRSHPAPDVWGCVPWVRSHPAPDVCGVCTLGKEESPIGLLGPHFTTPGFQKDLSSV